MEYPHPRVIQKTETPEESVEKIQERSRAERQVHVDVFFDPALCPRRAGRRDLCRVRRTTQAVANRQEVGGFAARVAIVLLRPPEDVVLVPVDQAIPQALCATRGQKHVLVHRALLAATEPRSPHAQEPLRIEAAEPNGPTLEIHLPGQDEAREIGWRRSQGAR